MNKFIRSSFELYTEQDFDTLLNIKTNPYIETFTNHHSNRYEPTIYRDLLSLYNMMKEDITKDALLVDFGSGLMRVPIFTNYVFKIKTIGMELNKQLYLKSLENIKNYSLLHHQENDVTAQNINALQYQFNGEETHLFFFNPFSVFVFQKVMENLMTSSIEKCDIILYYAKPEYEVYLQDIIHFNLKYHIPLQHINNDPSEKINIYEYTKSI
nr:hypothetical protein [Macrococcus sp. IME1552]